MEVCNVNVSNFDLVPVTAELVNTLLILGAAQGLFLAALLATTQSNAAANNVLAVAMVAFTLFIVQGVYYAQAYYYAFPHFIGVSVPLVFVFGPILYLYARMASKGRRIARTRSLLHFVPFALIVVYLAPFYGQGGTEKIAFLHALLREGAPLDVALIGHLQYPHVIAYVALTVRLLKRHRARLRNTHSYMERINLLWLRNLTIGIVAVWTLATGLHLLDIAGLGSNVVEGNLTPLAVSCMVYAIGYLGLRQPEIFHPPTQERSGAQAFELNEGAAARPLNQAISNAPPVLPAGDLRAIRPPKAQADNESYEKSGLTQAEARAHRERLIRLMEEKQPFKRNLLTLPELADELSISPHNLSEVINKQLGKNFYDFVNEYRVKEVQRRLQDLQSDHLTILAVAEESGFNSKSAFNACFKKYTGLTPSQYKARHRDA
jgi:AraC-like DNA-binding protein